MNLWFFLREAVILCSPPTPHLIIFEVWSFFYLPSLFVVVILCSRLTIYLNNMRWWFYDLFSLRGCDSMLSPHSLPKYLRLWFYFLFSLPSLLFEVVILWSLLTLYLIIWGCDFVFSFHFISYYLRLWFYDLFST